MSKDIAQFDCPCCGKRLEFDMRTHKARAVKVAESKVSKDFDSLLSDQKAEKARLDGAFGAAVDAQRREKKTLLDMFSDAKKKADEDPDDVPKRPFDLD